MTEPAPSRATRVRFVSPDEARRAALAGAVVFDTRGLVERTRAAVRGTVGFSWTRWRTGWTRSGLLTTKLDALVAHLRSSGMRFDRPAVVAGAGPDGFGEEGRLAWTLAYLGHPDVAVLDRSIRHLDEVPAPRPALDAPSGRPRPPRAGGQAEVAGALHAGGRLLGQSSPEEFRRHPYGAARGGHLPAARALHGWRCTTTRACSAPQIPFASRRDPDRPVITYRTAAPARAPGVLDSGTPRRELRRGTWERSADPATLKPAEEVRGRVSRQGPAPR